MRHFLLALLLKDDCRLLVLSAGGAPLTFKKSFLSEAPVALGSGWESRGRKRSQDCGSEMFMAHVGESGVEALGRRGVCVWGCLLLALRPHKVVDLLRLISLKTLLPFSRSGEGSGLERRCRALPCPVSAPAGRPSASDFACSTGSARRPSRRHR